MSNLLTRLRESFDDCAYDYLSAWEHDPDMEIINNEITGRDPKVEAHECEMVQFFWGLRDSVDAIPQAIISDVEARRTSLGDERFEALFEQTIEAVGRRSFPKNATDFMGTLILNLQFAGVLFL